MRRDLDTSLGLRSRAEQSPRDGDNRRLKHLLHNVHQPNERNENAADPIPLAEFNDDMRHAGGPMLTVRFQ
jgi:hypothetical protein